MRVLIIGCGYVGLPLGQSLAAQGHTVCGIHRAAHLDTDLIAAGIEPVSADITKPEHLNRLDPAFDWVVSTVSSSQGGIEQFRQVYRQGTRNILDWLLKSPPKKFVYTSSTSVYGQTDGSQVKETSPTEPATETGQILAETESLLLEAARSHHFPAVILRSAGIYGPERGHLFLRFLKDQAAIQGHGEHYINMIHRDDLVGCIIAVLKNGRPGEIYNAVDDEPVPHIHFFRWLSETLGKSMPPFVPNADIPSSKRGVTNKKVLNRKLKMELGYQFRYPTFRQGYTAEIQRLEETGVLSDYLAPQPR